MIASRGGHSLMWIGEEISVLGYENNPRINRHWLAPFYVNLQVPMKIEGVRLPPLTERRFRCPK